MLDKTVFVFSLITLYLGVGFVILGRLQHQMVILKKWSIPFLILLPSIMFVRMMTYLNKPNILCIGLFMPMYGYLMVSSFMSYQIIKPLFHIK